MLERDDRWPCNFPIELKFRDQVLACRIVNISRYGARVSPSTGLAVGTRVSFRFGVNTHEGDVRWVREDQAGIALLHVMSERQIQVIRTGAASVSHGLREMS